MLADNLLEAPFVCKFVGIILQKQGNGGASFATLARADDVGVVAVAFPLGGLSIGLVRQTLYHDALCHHKRRIKAHTELPDEVATLASLEAFDERLGARFGNGAKVFGQLGAGHARARIADGNGVCLGINGDVDVRLELSITDVGIGDLHKAHAVDGVGGVRDELAEEDFTVGVE